MQFKSEEPNFTCVVGVSHGDKISISCGHVDRLLVMFQFVALWGPPVVTFHAVLTTYGTLQHTPPETVRFDDVLVNKGNGWVSQEIVAWQEWTEKSWKRCTKPINVHINSKVWPQMHKMRFNNYLVLDAPFTSVTCQKCDATSLAL